MNLRDVVTGRITGMSSVHRYSSFPTIRRENVAEHSWWVSFIAYLISRDLVAQGRVVDFGVVVSKAIMHDVSECVSGDIIRSYKHSNGHIADVMLEADQLNMDRLFDGDEYHPIGYGLKKDWESAKISHRLEGQVVAFADMAAVAFYIREEYLLGNRKLLYVLKEMYETWFHTYHEHPQLGQYIGQMFPNRRFTDILQDLDLQAKPMMSDHSEGATTVVDFSKFREEWPDTKGMD